jgi:hypothetical protein
MQVLHHLRSLNVCHFGMPTARALELCSLCHLQWHDLPTEFHENLPIGSEVDEGRGQTDT